MTTTKKKPAKKATKKANPQVKHSNAPVMWIRVEHMGSSAEMDITIDPRFPREKVKGYLTDIINAVSSK